VHDPALDRGRAFEQRGAFLRKIIEHADGNFTAAKKDTPRGGFVQKSNLLPELPGQLRRVSDATGLIVDQDGCWPWRASQCGARSGPGALHLQPLVWPPQSSQWLHEIELDGFRTAARIDNGHVQLLTMTGV
jgi:hypothetical protein